MVDLVAEMKAARLGQDRKLQAQKHH